MQIQIKTGRGGDGTLEQLASTEAYGRGTWVVVEVEEEECSDPNRPATGGCPRFIPKTRLQALQFPAAPLFEVTMLGSSTPTSCEELPFESTRKPSRVGLRAVPSPWASALPPTAPDFASLRTAAAREGPNTVFQARKPQSAKRAMSVGCQVVFSSQDVTTSTFYSRTSESETSVEVCPHCLREDQLRSPRFPGWPLPWFSLPRPQFPFPAGSLCTCASPISALLPPPHPNYGPPNLPYFPSLPSYPFCYYPQHPIVMPFDVWFHSNPSTEEGPAIMECVVEPFEGGVLDEEVDRSMGIQKDSPPSKTTSVAAIAAGGSADAPSSRASDSGLPEARPKPAGCTPKSASPATRGVELLSATVEGAGESDKTKTAAATPLEVQKDEAAGSTGSPAGTASGVDSKPTEERREGGSTGASPPLEAATKAAEVPGSGASIERSSATPNGVPEQALQAQAAQKTADPKVNFKSPGVSKPTSSSLAESDLTSSTVTAVSSLPGDAGGGTEQLDASPDKSPGTCSPDASPDPKDEDVATSPTVEEHEVDMETQEESLAEEDDPLAETELGADVSKKGRYTRAGIICAMVMLSLVLLFIVYGIAAPGSAQKGRILGTTPLFVDVDVGGNESEAVAVQDELHVIDIPLDF
ncbi:uncharacterized protein LOC8034401 isoform X2 [Ixodes scapularis]|uniref:uncharacterized protein LOC8034401 isoform X2 n=1 Tax=Ixodes scapularis TaxID=6945 RepID=UPI001C395BC4|nr:uncharacterized protein LOC8034401 isoform X2 [Ixodes scapularis]